MSSENYTSKDKFYTNNCKNILLLKSAIFDVGEMMTETTDEREQGRLRHAIRVLRKELWYQQRSLELSKEVLFCAESDFAQ